MNINGINSLQNYNFPGITNYRAASTAYNQPIYKADTVFLNTNPSSDYENPFEPNQPIDQKPSFFNRGEVRLAGVFLGSGMAFGAVGAAVGYGLGNAGLGAAIGGGVGLIVPAVLIAYAIQKLKW